MPSKPKRISSRSKVLVRHVSGAEKEVSHPKLSSLGTNWSRVRKTGKPVTKPSAPPSAITPAEPLDSAQGDADGLQPNPTGGN